MPLTDQGGTAAVPATSVGICGGLFPFASIIMNISQRLLLTLSLALLALIGVGAGGIWQSQKSAERFEYLNDNTLASVRTFGRVNEALTAMRIAMYRHALAMDAKDMDEAEKALADGDKRFSDALARYEKDLVSDDEDRKLLDNVKTAAAAVAAARVPFLQASRANDRGVAQGMLTTGELRVAILALMKSITEIVTYNTKSGDLAVDRNREAQQSAMTMALLIIVVAVAIVSVLALLLYQRIRRSLADIENTLVYVSDTLDLDRRATVGQMDEIGRTAAAFNALMTRIAGAMREVRQTTDSVSVAARQIAAGNTDLSARTEQQAASLEETAASMEQMTTTVKQSTESAVQASQLANDAADVANVGQASVERMVVTMQSISSSSTRIAEITSLIEGIAFQTNILALNAAVEAARAGEQGRGFAVVAGEVRSLAQRSSGAAKEIKELIDSSVTMVGTGSAQAAEAGDNMTAIRASVKRVSEIIGEIATAAREQNAGIDQVNQAVGQMDQVTQQNAALVEEAAAAAQSLDDQADKLRSTVGTFRLAD